MKNFMILIVTTLLCSTASAQHTCHIMYDAGSSGTRLYIYEQQDSIWVPHEGPKVGALADPVREILPHVVNARDSYGGTAQAQVEAQIAEARAALAG